MAGLALGELARWGHFCLPVWIHEPNATGPPGDRLPLSAVAAERPRLRACPPLQAPALRVKASLPLWQPSCIVVRQEVCGQKNAPAPGRGHSSRVMTEVLRYSEYYWTKEIFFI